MMVNGVVTWRCWPRRLAVATLVLAASPLIAASSTASAAHGSTPARASLPSIGSTVLDAASMPASPAPVSTVALAAFRQVRGLTRQALASALDAVAAAHSRGVAGRDDVLTVIDYSLPSTQPRLWVLDLTHGTVLFSELVAHGAGSGDTYAVHFSNDMNSRQTSLGLFLTGATYQGGNGYSLRLQGLDAGVNDLAEERNIVMHGAWYVSADHARRFGRIGRSWGCPALPADVAPAVIDAIKGGSFIYAYAGSRPALDTRTVD